MIMKSTVLVSVLLLASIYVSCSDPDDHLTSGPEQPVVEVDKELEFKRWIYASMNRHYYWREDLPDSTTCNYDLTPSEFYKSLLSPKDRFSYMSYNDYYDPDRELNFGFEYQAYKDLSNQLGWLVLYTTSHEADAHVIRGDFVRLDGIENGVATFRKLKVENGVFVEDTTFKLTGADKWTANSTVKMDSIYHYGEKKVGYLVYLQYENKSDLYPSLEKFKNAQIDELILDLRYNPGGYVSTAKYLCNCIVPSSGYENVFQIQHFNDIIAAENELNYGSPIDVEYFNPAPQTGTATLGKGVIALGINRLVVLTSNGTASASESNIIGLRPYMDVICIGETTYGKGVGSYTVRNDKYRYALQPITFQYYNALYETVPNEGIEPDFYVDSSPTSQKYHLGDLKEPLLEAAFAYLFGTASPAAKDMTRTGHNQLTLMKQGEPSYMEKFKQKHFER